MEKFNFTSEGAAALIAALYAETDAVLQREAQHVAADFADWLLSKFNFEAPQINYLTSMSEPLLSFMGAQVSFAMRHRLPIKLIKPLQRSAASARETKLIETKTKIDASGDGAGGERGDGEVIIEINY